MLRRVPWIDVAVVTVFGVISFLQHPGQTRFDSKLQLVTDPWGFLAGAVSAWDPANFGQVQNQSYGYLWPMGPFFGVLHSIGVPAWIVQALWMWLILAVAYLGVRLLARKLGLPTYAAVIAGVAYALAPRLITELGPLSEETLPAALAPWMLLPLVRPKHTAFRAAFLAAIPVLCMGAVNASATLAVLPILVIWVLFRCVDRWRILGWWLAFVGAFSLWWVVPLVVQGRVATPFLGLIETASDTTAQLNAAEVLRGDVQWISPLVLNGQPWWPAGYAFATQELVIVATLLVAALGVFGLASRRMPARVAFAVMFAVGAVIMSLGAIDSLGHEQWWALLDGPLAPFRNIHKFDPLVRLPLVIGVATCVTVLSRVQKHVPAVLASLVVAAAGLPLVLPGVAAGQTWSSIPQWWKDSAAWLDRNPGRALVVPGSGFDTYVWGRTIDNPLQALGVGTAVVDTALPLGNIGTQRLLDGINSALRAGRQSVGLAAVLARSGVQYVVVRNDLDTTAARAPSRSVVAATLQQSPGFEFAAAFGTAITHTTPLSSVNFDSEGTRPAVEIYRVTPDAPSAQAIELSDVATATGAAESLIPMIGTRALADLQPVVFADDGVVGQGPVITTDSLVRRDRGLGRGDVAASAPMTAGEASRLRRALPDMIPTRDPHFTVAEYEGIEGVSASTSRAFADALQPIQVAAAPFAALDGDGSSWWMSSSSSGAIGQWWRVDLEAPRNLDGASAEFISNTLVGPAVTRVLVSTDHGSFESVVAADGTLGPLRDAVLRDARWLSVTVLDTAVRQSWGDVVISEVNLPDIEASMWLRTATPPAQTDRSSALVLQGDVSTPVCVAVDLGTRCDPLRPRLGGPLHRIVTLDGPISGAPLISGVVRPGGAAAALFDGFEAMLRATATTWLGGDPNVRPSAAIDGNAATAWVADPLDSTPEITVEWGEERVISSIQIVPAQLQQQFAVPLAVTVTVNGEEYSAELTAGGVVRFPERRATSLSVRIDRSTPVKSLDTLTGAQIGVPPAIGEILIDGLEDLVYTPLPDQKVNIPCGFGPEVTIDGDSTSTRIDTTLGDVLNGRTMTIIPCASLALPAGEHRISVAETGLITPTGFTWAPGAQAVVERDVRVEAWDSSNRTIDVAPGDAAVLRLTDAANPGWSATLDGRALEPIRVDGWQQGWIVPAGEGGAVQILFAPTRIQQIGLIAGACTAALALLTGIVVRGRRRWTVRESAGIALPWVRALRWAPHLAAGLVLVAIVPALAGAALVAGLLAACAVMVVFAAAVCSSHG